MPNANIELLNDMDKIENNTTKKKIKGKKAAKRKQKIKKLKKKIETRIVFAPKARLEPRLNLSSKKNKSQKEVNIEKDKRLVVSLNANEIENHLESFNLEKISKLKSSSTTRKTNEGNETSDGSNISSSEKENCGASLKNTDTSYDDVEDFQDFIKQSKGHVTKGMYWTDKEIRDLAYALQCHGFADMKKIAEEVKTKNENDIMVFVKSRIAEKRRAKTRNFEPERHRGRPPNDWTTVSHENLETWPTVRKWKRLAYEQMLSYTRSKDYSRPVIIALCEKFYEEAPELADPEIIDIKLIYKYIADCMKGVIPPQLSPKESALVVDMLREVNLIPLAYDFEEERQFLKNFKSATTFKPFQVKDEFKKKLKRAPEEMNDPNTVCVPEEVFLELSRHKRLLQSFSPIMTPVWMIQKEQEYLEKYFEESSVYVD